MVDLGFFNLSYDWSNDQNKEAGLDPDITILSVNHDFWGTWITYLGYLLLAIDSWEHFLIHLLDL